MITAGTILLKKVYNLVITPPLVVLLKPMCYTRYGTGENPAFSTTRMGLLCGNGATIMPTKPITCQRTPGGIRLLAVVSAACLLIPASGWGAGAKTLAG